MRNATTSLNTFLASGLPFWSADLFTVTLANGSIIYWTSADRSILANTNVYSALGPALTRSRWSVKQTIDVPEMEINLISSGADYSSNIKMLIHNGFLDGASFTLERAFMPTFSDTSLGVVLLFSGYVSTVTVNAIGALIKVKGGSVFLQRYMPRNNYTLSCVHTVYDAGCTLNRSSFTSNNTCGAGSGVTRIVWGSTPPLANTRYALGTVTMTSGAAQGEVRTISGSDTTAFVVTYPFYQTPATGDTFKVQAGCDRSLATCGVFGNTTHYRGFPFIPPAETGY